MAGPIASALTAGTVREIEVDGVGWRLRLLDTAAAAEARTLLEMASWVLPEHPDADPDAQDPARAARQAPTPAQERQAMAKVGLVLRASVMAARAPGCEWEPIEVVLSPDDQDPDRGRVWVGALPEALVGRLYAETVAQLLEARRALHPFRQPAPDALGPGPAGPPVRDDAP